MRGHSFRGVAAWALGCALGFVGSIAWAGEHSPADIEEAKKHMKNGVALMEDPDGARYEEAFPEFKKAYELSDSLNALQNMAICSMKLERDGEAIDYYEKFLAGKGDTLDQATKDQVDRDLSTLKSTVAWITVKSDKTGVTLTDVRTPSKGSTVTNTYTIGMQSKRLGIHPGQHTFTASLSGKPDITWPVKLENGSKQDHSFYYDKGAVTAEGLRPDDLNPNPKPDDKPGTEPNRPVPVYAWVVGGISWAMVPATIALMVVAKGKKDDYEKNIKGIEPIADQEAARDSVKSANLVADVMLGVTSAAVVTSTILFLVRPEAPPAEQASGTSTGLRYGVDYTVAPSVDATGGGAFATVRF